MSNHSFFAPSSSERWLECPPSRILETSLETLFPQPTRAEATLGTELHDIASKCLNENVFESDNAIVDFYLKYIKKLIDENQITEFYVEKKISFAHIFATGFGTADFIGYGKDGTLHIVDFKTGQVRVSAVKNTQLCFYMFGAWKNIKSTNSNTFHIVQPSTKSTSVWKVEGSWLKNIKYKIENMLNDMLTLQLKSGTHCKYCRAKMFCPKFKTFIDGTHKSLGQSISYEELDYLWDCVKLAKSLEKELINFYIQKLSSSEKPLKYKAVCEGGKLEWEEGAFEKAKSHVMSEYLFETKLKNIKTASNILEGNHRKGLIKETSATYKIEKIK